MSEAIKAAFDRKELSSPESGSMCYMLSKQQYLSDRDGHWHPHLMFFVPPAEHATWGAACRVPRLWKLTSLPDRSDPLSDSGQ